ACDNRSVSANVAMTPTATRQSSPTMKSYQKSPNRLTMSGRDHWSERLGARDAHHRDKGDEPEEEDVASGPVNPGALGSPEHSKRRQHHADDEFHEIFRHPAQRRVDDDADGADDQCGTGCA